MKNRFLNFNLHEPKIAGFKNYAVFFWSLARAEKKYEFENLLKYLKAHINNVADCLAAAEKRNLN